MILEVKDINTYYGTSHILFGVSISVAEGEAVCLLGRNGAGKTTTMRSVIGLTPPRSGSIRFLGKETRGMRAYAVSRLGIGYAPDDRRVFPDLTVRQNLEIARRPDKDNGKEWTVDRVYELFPVLKKLDNHPAGFLSGGEQRMLVVGRGLMNNPRLLLLDEPAEGLSPVVVKQLKEQIQSLKAEGVTILLSEQNVPFAMALSDRAYVIEKGAIRYQGSIAELKENQEVRKRYLLV